jgi:hypothetical protein
MFDGMRHPTVAFVLRQTPPAWTRSQGLQSFDPVQSAADTFGK